GRPILLIRNKGTAASTALDPDWSLNRTFCSEYSFPDCCVQQMESGNLVPELAAFDRHFVSIKRAWYAWENDGMRRELNDAREMRRELDRIVSTCATSSWARCRMAHSSKCPSL